MISNDRQTPLRVLFLTTSMPVGGAETLLVNLVRGMDRCRFAPEIGCLKTPGPLGELLASEIPVHSRLLVNRYDLRVLRRLWRLLRTRQIDAVVTVGAGDKMFWGRLAARLARVPVVISALHSTGWPDSVGRLNRLLTPLTDAFVGVADAHAKHLIHHEQFSADKVHTIYNGVDTDRFAPGEGAVVRRELGLPSQSPIVAIVAALRPEKNHELFLAGAQRISHALPAARFLVVGDGPQRAPLEQLARTLGIDAVVHFLGSRSDIPDLLRAVDVFALTSHNEASPVSILEAMSSGVAVVAADVGSVRETVVPGETGELFAAGDLEGFVSATLRLLDDSAYRAQLGEQGRQRVMRQWSLQSMVQGYQTLIEQLYHAKQPASVRPSNPPAIPQPIDSHLT